MAWQTFYKQVYTNKVTKQAIITYIFTLFKKICLIHKSKQTVYWQPIDKNNWGTFVKAACMYTNYCLSFFIMKMHLLVQLGKLKHAETAIWRKCSSPYARTSLFVQASLNNILHDTFSLLLNPTLRMGSLSLDVIFKFLTTESTSQIEAGRMS